MRLLLLFVLICFYGSILGQSGIGLNSKYLGAELIPTKIFHYQSLFFHFPPLPKKQIAPISKIKWSFQSPYQRMDELGFVCKWELKLDKVTRNPIRFRLGSYDYVNKLEGK